VGEGQQAPFVFKRDGVERREEFLLWLMLVAQKQRFFKDRPAHQSGQETCFAD